MKSRRCFRLLLLTSMKIKNGNDHCSLQESDYILTYPITNNVSEIFFSEIFKVHFHRGFVIIVRDFANQVRRRCFSSVCMHPKSTFHRDFYNTMRRQYAQSVLTNNNFEIHSGTEYATRENFISGKTIFYSTPESDSNKL